MTEYELQQLAAGSRYEFDGATLAYMAWAVVFLFLSRGAADRWSARTGLLLAALYLSGGALMIVRCLAAMGRYGKQIALLNQLPAQYVLANPPLQSSTLVIRMALFAIAPVAVLYFLALRVRR